MAISITEVTLAEPPFVLEQAVHDWLVEAAQMTAAGALEAQLED